MTIRLYMDVHVPRAITETLQLHDVDVITAQEDHADRLSDPKLLERATQLGRVLFSQDSDLLREAARRQHSGESFSGVIYARQRSVTIGKCIDDLELFAKVSEPEDFLNAVEYLPLK